MAVWRRQVQLDVPSVAVNRRLNGSELPRGRMLADREM